MKRSWEGHAVRRTYKPLLESVQDDDSYFSENYEIDIERICTHLAHHDRPCGRFIATFLLDMKSPEHIMDMTLEELDSKIEFLKITTQNYINTMLTDKYNLTNSAEILNINREVLRDAFYGPLLHQDYQNLDKYIPIVITRCIKT